mmetsp:Transcript_60138/g.162118  ORF Transcript_60138/g.162118 Transcript_60138/m.162118 type:complete len:475 (-) Transcript_60138:323-1747(-)
MMKGRAAGGGPRSEELLRLRQVRDGPLSPQHALHDVHLLDVLQGLEVDVEALVQPHHGGEPLADRVHLDHQLVHVGVDQELAALHAEAYLVLRVLGHIQLLPRARLSRRKGGNVELAHPLILDVRRGGGEESVPFELRVADGYHVFPALTFVLRVELLDLLGDSPPLQEAPVLLLAPALRPHEPLADVRLALAARVLPSTDDPDVQLAQQLADLRVEQTTRLLHPALDRQRHKNHLPCHVALLQDLHGEVLALGQLPAHLLRPRTQALLLRERHGQVQAQAVEEKAGGEERVVPVEYHDRLRLLRIGLLGVPPVRAPLDRGAAGRSSLGSAAREQRLHGLHGGLRHARARQPVVPAQRRRDGAVRHAELALLADPVVVVDLPGLVPVHGAGLRGLVDGGYHPRLARAAVLVPLRPRLGVADDDQVDLCVLLARHPHAWLQRRQGLPNRPLMAHHVQRSGSRNGAVVAAIRRVST